MPPAFRCQATGAAGMALSGGSPGSGDGIAYAACAEAPITRATWVACHCPPRLVRTPAPFNPRAMATRLSWPSACNSPMASFTRALNADALACLAAPLGGIDLETPKAP
jgi:hypothetical protein